MNFKNIKIFAAGMLLFCSMLCKPALAIKIGLLEDVAQNYIAVSNQGYIFDGNSNAKIVDLQPMKKYYIKKYNQNVAILIGSQYYDLGSSYLLVQASSNGFVSTKNRWYRGNLIVLNKTKGLTVINNVTLENYLLGVVPSEMPSSWNTEAHKAQAIAARSYAIANSGKRASHGYDLKDTPEDQAYGGASSETQKTNSAVLNTKGQVLTYNDKVIPAYYHASSGGQTLTSGEVWGKDLPFIHSVPSFDNFKPKNGHGIGMSQYGANTLANDGYNVYQILNYFYKDIAFRTISSSF